MSKMESAISSWLNRWALQDELLLFQTKLHFHSRQPNGLFLEMPKSKKNSFVSLAKAEILAKIQ